MCIFGGSRSVAPPPPLPPAPPPPLPPAPTAPPPDPVVQDVNPQVDKAMDERSKKDDKENAKEFTNESKSMKLTSMLNESFGFGELPSEKLIKMKVSAKDMLDSVKNKKVNESEVVKEEEGVKHYTKDGKEWKGATHKMKDGTLHTGKTHTANSKRLYHFKDLSAKAKKVAKA